MAVKKAIYQVDNGSGFDEIHFKTTAEQVICNDGKTVEASLVEITNEALNEANGWFRDKKTRFMIQYGSTRTSRANINNIYTHNLTFPAMFKNKFISFVPSLAKCEKADGTTVDAIVNIRGYVVYDSKSRIGIRYSVESYVEGSIIINWIATGY